jgi:8-oxo-dGTP diphosphatase
MNRMGNVVRQLSLQENAMSVTYDFPRPSVTVDVVVLGFDDPDNQTVKVLLIKRGRPGTAFEGCWALPGGFVDENEDLEVAACRELREETHVEREDLVQVGAFGRPGRDPRGHVISVAYVNRKFVRCSWLRPRADDDAKDVQWWPLTDLPPLAFDHAEILADAHKRWQTMRPPLFHRNG